MAIETENFSQESSWSPRDIDFLFVGVYEQGSQRQWIDTYVTSVRFIYVLQWWHIHRYEADYWLPVVYNGLFRMRSA